MHTSAGNATFLSNVSPLFVGLFTWMLTRKLPSGRFWAALLVSTVGSCLIVTADLRHAFSRSSADGLAVVAAVCFALYLVITGQLRAKVDAGMLLALSTTASAVTLFICAAAGHFSLVVPGFGPLWALLGLGLVCQVGGYFGLTYALGHLPATVTSILWLTIAPATAGFAWMIFGERMSPMEIAGAGADRSLDRRAAGEGGRSAGGGADSAGGAGLIPTASASAAHPAPRGVCAKPAPGASGAAHPRRR